MDYIVLAIPVFFLLIGVELVATRGRGYYRLSDSVNDLSCGILQQVLGAFLRVALFAAYVLVHDRLRLATIPIGSPAAWVACFLGVDFFYYWFHRTSHEVNAAWAAHVVHHQSEEYNLSVALRQGAFQQLFSWPFYLPLALVGFPPPMFLALSSFNTLYQFWIHTRAIGRLGPLEWVLNTPSHHRVHHARNPKYIDRNHGGTLIVWDRLFGSFVPEEEEPVYGITKPLATWNPLWANLQVWAELVSAARQTSRWRDRLRLFVARPGWRPDELGGFQPPPEVDRASYRPFDPPVARSLGGYVLVQFAFVVLFSALWLLGYANLDLPERLGGAALIVVSVTSFGGLLEGRRWAYGLEVARLLIAALILAVAAWPLGTGAALGGALLSAPWLAWLLRCRSLPGSVQVARATIPVVR